MAAQVTHINTACILLIKKIKRKKSQTTQTYVLQNVIQKDICYAEKAHKQAEKSNQALRLVNLNIFNI